MLEWTPEIPPAGVDGSPLFHALQEQLGLKLEDSKALVTVLVIDHIDRPAAN